MEISDEYQDLGNPGGGVAIANGMSLEHHRHSSDSPLSHQEEDLSDPDLQDEESGEELPQQPHQANTHTSDSASVPTSTPTPLAHLNSLMSAHHPHFLAKFKMESDTDMFNNKSSIEALQAAMGTGTFNLPFSFPPPAAFLTPQHHNNHHHSSIGTGNAANNAVASSADSHSSESSQGSARNASDARETSGSQSQNNTNNNNSHQQTSWSFEEQFKQVRQLYEINDDPKRKEFLDDLFSYMQKRGTPINRLPIMAKSVLDLYELYNLVIARGGLVDVINKKLWQEIIKGLHLPSSITSAAFTLRTQYMKYLYPYECEKLRLSNPAELQAAIDGNRREGRRSSYGAYAGGTGAGDNMIGRNPHPPSSLASLHAQVSPMSLVTGGQHHGSQSLVNGSAAHTPLTHHPHLPQHAQGPLAHQPNAGSMGSMLPMEIEARMVEYVKLMNKEMRIGGSRSPPPIANRQASPPATPPRDIPPLNALGFSFWNLYNNNTLYSSLGHQQQHPMSPQTSQSPNPQSSSPEPQREALDLGLRSPPMSTSPSRQSPTTSASTIQTKREKDVDEDGPPAPKRPLNDDEMSEKQAPLVLGANIKITNRNDGGNSDHSLSVSIELNGTTYQGVLFPQGDSHNAPSTTTTNNHQKTLA